MSRQARRMAVVSLIRYVPGEDALLSLTPCLLPSMCLMPSVNPHNLLFEVQGVCPHARKFLGLLYFCFYSLTFVISKTAEYSIYSGRKETLSI